MLKRCKITASPPARAKPMWFRKAPDCLHRQILKKYFPLKHNPPAHPLPLPPRSPLTPYPSLPGNYLLRLLPPGQSQSSGTGSWWQEITQRRELAVLPARPPISQQRQACLAARHGELLRGGWILALRAEASPGQEPEAAPGRRSEQGLPLLCQHPGKWVRVCRAETGKARGKRALGSPPGLCPCPPPRRLPAGEAGLPQMAPSSIQQMLHRDGKVQFLPGWGGDWRWFCFCQGHHGRGTGWRGTGVKCLSLPRWAIPCDTDESSHVLMINWWGFPHLPPYGSS